VPRAVFDHTDGAAGAEIALRRSRQAFERVEFCPSVLRVVPAVDALRRRFDLPLSVDTWRATVAAASRAGTTPDRGEGYPARGRTAVRR